MEYLLCLPRMAVSTITIVRAAARMRRNLGIQIRSVMLCFIMHSQFVIARKRIALFGALAVIHISANDAMAQNLLVNGGFETGDFSGWTVGGTAPFGIATDGRPVLGTFYADSQVNVRGGTYAAWANTQSGANLSTKLELSQKLTLEPNTRYAVGFWFSIATAGDVSFVNRARLNDLYLLRATVDGFSPPVPESLLDFHGFTSSDFSNYEAAFSTGPNASEATITFELAGYARDQGGAVLGSAGVSYDDFYVTRVAAVPEPTPLVLGLATAFAGIGGRAFCRGRRKNSCWRASRNRPAA